MIKVVKSEDCGNSPKSQFVENVEIAIAKSNSEFLVNVIPPLKDGRHVLTGY